jgi:enoyl-CoA hydratase/carnithine racemase
MTDRVLTELDEDGVLLVTFNRPEKKNAFDEQQWQEAAAALREAQENPRVAVVVLTGAGGDFSAGVDLSSFGRRREPGDEERPSGYAVFMEALTAFDKPLLAAVRGVGVGIGCTMLLHCDAVYVGESLRLRMPFAALGLCPEGASSYLLEAVVGARTAAELLLTAEWIGAERAVSTGIATAALPDEDVLPAAMAKAREMSQFSVGALQSIKRTLLASRRASVEAALRVEAAEMAAQVGSPENVEAIAAFRERRAPDFRKLRRQVRE